MPEQSEPGGQSQPLHSEENIRSRGGGRDRRTCRGCGEPLIISFLDLGAMPLANSLLTAEQLNNPEIYYPLHAFVCGRCFLVQLEQYNAPEDMFSNYVYFSSFSDTWLAHARDYVEEIIPQLGLDSDSLVVEIASNDGYLLQYFVEKGIPVLGIEPAANVARVAITKGIPSKVAFFGEALARDLAEGGKQADLIVANNVLAHVPDLNDFVTGMTRLLKSGGVISVEFPHLLNLINQTQFDTIYHEHFSYFSFGAAERVFARHKLKIFDVRELPTHGGSLRLYVAHADNEAKVETTQVGRLRQNERKASMDQIVTYAGFADKVKQAKLDLLSFFVEAKRNSRRVVAYGAAAKGNTLLNYCGIGKDFIDFAADRNPHKQGLYLPGTHIPVYHPEKILDARPDFVLILPWNIKDEIVKTIGYIREWGGRFVVPIPTVEVMN